MLTKKQLIHELKTIGVRPGMHLLLHSSLRRVGPVEGGGDAVIDALLDTLGPEGTLMMATVSGNVSREQPVFHAVYTPSTVGALSNVFLKRPGVSRSLHPVHSIAACGARAAFFTEGHLDCPTPWSPDSPYGRIMREGGFILFFGTDFNVNSCLHAIEIEARVPGLHTVETTTLQVFDARGELREIEHHWHAPKRPYYRDMEHLVERAGGLTYGQIGSSISRLVDARILRETLLPLFRERPELGIRALTDSRFVWE